jgi:multiple sugar transport system substrate-binding protein
MKTNLSRRMVVKGGTALVTASTLTGSALPEWAGAWAQTVPWKPENGAQLSLLRAKAFVPAEDDGFVAVLNAFTKSTGVKVNITRESNDDVQPKALVAANTGAGPDLFWGIFSLPHLFPQKCVDVSDVAEYLGKKYGGWVASAIAYRKGKGDKWIDLPIAWGGNVMNYRKSQVSPESLQQRTSSWNTRRRQRRTAGLAVSHSAMLREMAMAGCIGVSGRMAALRSI